jgi:hypothetical protein
MASIRLKRLDDCQYLLVRQISQAMTNYADIGDIG